jgi:cell division septum initiation protein DivIVA
MPHLHDQEAEDGGTLGGGTRSPAAAALVSAAERAADEILAEARADAGRLRAEAAADAARTRRDADEDARQVVRDARDSVDDVLRAAQTLARQLEQLGTALHRNAERLLDDVRAAHNALRAEADAAAARLPAATDGDGVGFDVHVSRGRDLPFEPRPDFEIPPSLHGRR